jgi:hypothetical protein
MELFQYITAENIERPPTEAEAKTIFRQIVEALHFLHEKKKNPLSFFSLHGVPQRRFAGRRRFYRGMADCINKYSAMRGRIGFTECKVLPVFHLHFIILSASPQYARTCIRQPSHLPTDGL